MEQLEEGLWSLSSLKKEFSKETGFIRSKVRVEEHTGKLGVSCVQLGWLRLLIWGQFSGLSLANHLACAHLWSVKGQWATRCGCSTWGLSISYLMTRSQYKSETVVGACVVKEESSQLRNLKEQ